MKKQAVGLWIDHRKAVIVNISMEGVKTQEIESGVETQPGRIDGARSTMPYESQFVPADDHLERVKNKHLNDYYDEIIAVISQADTIQIFGPGEAKGELKKRLEHAKFGGTITELEAVDKMTDRQIAAKVREHFQFADYSGSKELPAAIS